MRTREVLARSLGRLIIIAEDARARPAVGGGCLAACGCARVSSCMVVVVADERCIVLLDDSYCLL